MQDFFILKMIFRSIKFWYQGSDQFQIQKQYTYIFFHSFVIILILRIFDIISSFRDFILAFFFFIFYFFGFQAWNPTFFYFYLSIQLQAKFFSFSSTILFIFFVCIFSFSFSFIFFSFLVFIFTWYLKVQCREFAL